MFDIVDIDIRIDHQQFADTMDEIMRDESSRTGISFDWSDKESHLSKSNTSMYKVTFSNLDSSNTIDVVAEKSNNDIVFKPIALRNYNESFYKFNYYEDNDLANVMLLALKRLALKAKGSFGCTFDGQTTLVKDGRDISNHIVGTAIIDDKGKVYHLKYGQSIDEEDDNNDISSYVPKYLINDWLEENPQFQMKLQGIPKEDRFELMGQFAVYQKKKDMLTADQFRDIILQVGTFAEMVGGFKDSTVKHIYQFFV